MAKSSTTSGQFDIWSALDSGLTFSQMYPNPGRGIIVAKSSTTSGQLDIWSALGQAGLQSDEPPSRGI